MTTRQPVAVIRLWFLLLIFGFFAALIVLRLTQILQPRGYDFAAYWQASRMTLDGQNVYDSPTWLTMREHYQTALHSEAVFQYPLPLAVLFFPLALLPEETAYFGWMFANLLMTLFSLAVLLQTWPDRPAWFEITVTAGLFLFRPVYSALLGGQILFFWLLVLTLGVWLLERGRLFRGGAALALLLLKPSIGLPFLALFAVWLLFRKNFLALWGLVSGSLGLLALGMVFNPSWLGQYLANGGALMSKYNGIQVTVWGAAAQLLKGNFALVLGAALTIGILGLSLAALRRSCAGSQYFRAAAILLPAAVLIAPYSWSYDQTVLLLPLTLGLIALAQRWTAWVSAVVLALFLLLAAGLYFLASSLGHDVWSLWVTAATLALAAGCN